MKIQLWKWKSTKLTRIGAKFLYVSGILVSGTCAILFGFLDQCPPGDTFVAMSFIVRSVEALGVSAFSTASFAIVSNEFPNHISSVFATLETCIGIGLMTGPTIGGALYEVGGFGLPFWAIGAVICISGLMVFTCLPPPEDNTLKRKGSIFCLLKSLLVWVTILSLLAGAIGISFMDPTLSDHLDQFGISTLVVGLFFVIAPGLHALMAPVWGYFSDTKDIQSPLLIIGNVVGAIGYLFIGPTPLLPFLPSELWTVTVGLVLFGFTVGCSIVPTMKLFVIGARELGLPDSLNTYGLVSGLFNSMFCLGAFIGPTIGGALVEQIGFYYGSTLISGFYLFVMIITAIFFGLRRLRKQRLENRETDLTGHVESSLHRTLGQQDNSVSLTDRQADERGHQADERRPLLSNSTHIKSFETSFSSTSYSR
ncbi:MFS-type transporter SLC18B1-like [Physella acuta]|uniref:MFS-type transporter SLC18B1-like n=1 Tax=Physella acuta TaxID=109671 RepID=UPI0027DD59CE|nr:MFS-type transporter SLC18B1-like [Physella acuta]